MEKNIQKIVIREERPEDYKAVEQVAQHAFWNLHGPGCDEHLLVRKLRMDDAYLPRLSRIAVMDDKVVGAICYSKAYLHYGEVTKEILTFGPLCVDTSAQDYGVGGKLLTTTLQLAKEADYDAVVIFGEPGYYPKHGFVTCDQLDVTTMDDKNFDAFMGYEIKSGILSEWAAKFGCKGKFQETSVFENLPKEEAEQMNSEFPPLVKMRIPCQWSYDNADETKNGYSVVDAVQYKPAFCNLFNMYAHELSMYNPWLATQISREGNYLGKQVKEYFSDPDKKPYVILCEGKPAGFLVVSGHRATKKGEVDSFDIEELFVTIPWRRKGIAKDLVTRIFRQTDLPCECCVLENNTSAVAFWDHLLTAFGKPYTKDQAEDCIWHYLVRL